MFSFGAAHCRSGLQQVSASVSRNGEELFDFNCCEQYMMAAKARLFGDREVFAAIMKARDPKLQKELGRRVRNFDLAAWTGVVPQIIVAGNLAKFSANSQLLDYLLSTGRKRLVEGSPVDRIYGVGLHYDDPRIEDEACWLGQNLLGNALEAVRTRLETPTA